MSLKACAAVVLSVCLLCSCAEQSSYVIKVGRDVNRTDTLGLESIALKIDTMTFKTDSLYDISIFGVSEDRLFGMTADNCKQKSRVHTISIINQTFVLIRKIQHKQPYECQRSQQNRPINYVRSNPTLSQ